MENNIMSDYDKFLYCNNCRCIQIHIVSGSGKKRNCIVCGTNSDIDHKVNDYQ